MSTFAVAARGYPKAEVNCAKATLAKRRVTRNTAVQNRDGRAASPLAVVTGDAQKFEGAISERHLIDLGAILFRRYLGDVHQEVRGDIAVVGGVLQHVSLERGQRIVFDARGAQTVE